ncbi:MAG: dihydroorotate dehydrogenase electron transfer subunit [Oscillospiraceae bacterium]|nr:dihydroorotate dehydrogenase electron transfer subunit [Oscillospiraceae bacterium]
MPSAVIQKKEQLTDGVFRLRLRCTQIAPKQAGQFLHIKCGEEPGLRRPISISDYGGGEISVVVETKGAGTQWLSERLEGDTLDVLGPFGNGFPEIAEPGTLLVGGGIGVAPLVYAARRSGGLAVALLGYRSAENIICERDFESVGVKSYLTTDDTTGTVADILPQVLSAESITRIFTCGPRPMMDAVVRVAKEYGVTVYASLEERMGCGVGACLCCAAEVPSGDGGGFEMKRVCREGPVFLFA